MNPVLRWHLDHGYNQKGHHWHRIPYWIEKFTRFVSAKST